MLHRFSLSPFVLFPFSFFSLFLFCLISPVFACPFASSSHFFGSPEAVPPQEPPQQPSQASQPLAGPGRAEGVGRSSDEDSDSGPLRLVDPDAESEDEVEEEICEEVPPGDAALHARWDRGTCPSDRC